MGPVTTAVMDCLKNVEKEVFTMQDLFAYYKGDINYISFRNRANVLCKKGSIIKLETNLYKKPDKDELDEVEEVEESKEKIAEPSFGISEIGQGVVDYINKLEEENATYKKEFLLLVQKNKDIVEKSNIENSKIYQKLEQQLQFLQIKFHDKHQELINKIDVIRKLKDLPHITIEKHRSILKEQTEKSKKCIQELMKKIESYKEPVKKIPKKLFNRITTFKF